LKVRQLLLFSQINRGQKKGKKGEHLHAITLDTLFPQFQIILVVTCLDKTGFAVITALNDMIGPV